MTGTSPTHDADGTVVSFVAAIERGHHTHVAVDRPLVLLLQGPVGSFFEALRRSLRRQGFQVLKVNFNGGDWLFGHGPQTLNFCGSLAHWVAWLEGFVTRSRPVSIVLFGDSRPYHRAAIEIAARAGIPVWCLEEGYLRPHFVTCERSGNNARSLLRIEELDDTTDDAAVEPSRLVNGNLFNAMAFNAIGYFLAKAAGAVFFRGNVHHRQRGLVAEAFLWTRCFYRKRAFYYKNTQLLQYLVEHLDGRYFVVALQVHDDQQVVCHGRGWTMERLITETIQSFARYADAGAHLLVKVHPMDRGHRSYRGFAAAVARVSGCAERVHVIDDGSIGLLIRHSLGVVTVNSTSGLLALNHGKPVVALGDALYGVEGLLFGGAECLVRFWREGTKPDPAKVRRFFARMHASSLVNGSFYLRAWIEATSHVVAGRVLKASCAEVVPLAEAATVREDHVEGAQAAVRRPRFLGWATPKRSQLVN